MIEPEALAGEILARHTSIHAFCRAHDELCRTTVYQVLRGRYPGNMSKQAQRIADALGMADASRQERTSEELLAVLCSRCRARGKNKRKKCAACKAVTRDQAAAITKL